MEENAMTVSCLEPYCFDEYGWATTLIHKECKWKSYHTDQQTTTNKRVATEAALALNSDIERDTVPFVTINPSDCG
jgi:hypothetical protein